MDCAGTVRTVVPGLDLLPWEALSLAYMSHMGTTLYQSSTFPVPRHTRAWYKYMLAEHSPT